MNSEKAQVLELYQSLSALQPKYHELYRALEKQYESCQCYACKLRLIAFGMEVTSLNSNVSHLEAQLLPSLTGILDKLTIKHKISNDQVFIMN